MVELAGTKVDVVTIGECLRVKGTADPCRLSVRMDSDLVEAHAEASLHLPSGRVGERLAGACQRIQSLPQVRRLCGDRSCPFPLDLPLLPNFLFRVVRKAGFTPLDEPMDGERG